MASVWRLYYFQVIPTQGAIPEEGKEIKKLKKKLVEDVTNLSLKIYVN